MLREEFINRIERQMGLVPTGEQREAMQTFAAFLAHRSLPVAMILTGSAGTGKTTLAAAFVRTLLSLHQRLVLLAPTGRAAKVFSQYSGQSASTIHRKIYRQKTVGELYSAYSLSPNRHQDTLFMVDEASMIAADSGDGHSLLLDLLRYVQSGRNCRLLLIGDAAQLPPVGEEESPALNQDVLEPLGWAVYSASLNEVLRQTGESGILYNATAIRQLITHDEVTQLPRIQLNGFADVQCVPGDELIEALSDSYNSVGMDETMVICRSNKRANIFNQGIRNMILGREEQISSGDWLMVVKNKYLSVKAPTADGMADEASGGGTPLEFIANGDRGLVRKVRNVHEMHGFHFAEVTLEFPDYDHQELDTLVILDTLTAEAPALTAEQSEQLYTAILADYEHFATKAARQQAMRQDIYYNALQVKFSYAVTCHKAQGGQWAHIYIDQGYMTDEMLTPDYIHWLYTAFTRATEKLFLVNWPVTQLLNT